ncbi:MAG: hypothetical protein JWP74_1664 [Marmoricola sp.]|nr:hypothetical protein [Marmoricola sp.]
MVSTKEAAVTGGYWEDATTVVLTVQQKRAAVHLVRCDVRTDGGRVEALGSSYAPGSQ